MSRPLIALLLIGAVTLPPFTSASNASGTVSQIVSQPSPTTSGNIRVSIQLPGATTSCTSTGYTSWYSYDLPDGALSKLWGGIILAALNSGRSISITGSGNCDAYGIETVAAIAAL